MTAHGPRPEEQASGAPAVEGQAAGAGMLAPGATGSSPEPEPVAQVQAQQVRKRKSIRQLSREELEKLRMELAYQLGGACKMFINWVGRHTYYTYRVYYSLVFGEDRIIRRLKAIANTFELPAHEVIEYANEKFDQFKVNSVRRMVRTCEKLETMKLAKFHPHFAKIINDLSDIAKQNPNDEDLRKFVRRLKTMTVKQFIESWRVLEADANNIKDKYYPNLIYFILEGRDRGSYLNEALVAEVKKIAKKLGAKEDRINFVIERLPDYVDTDYIV